MDHLLVQIAVLLFFARGLGHVAKRLGQPTVIGELLAGILLGPTALGKVWPAAQHWIFPLDATQSQLLSTVARLGVLFLLLVTGFEINLAFILSRGRQVLQVALWGALVPLLLGCLLGFALPDMLMQDPSRRPLFAMFLAVSMSISALAVLAKILLDIDVLKRDLGQTMVAVAMTEDLVGWILLSVVVGLAAGEFRGEVALHALAGAVGFLTVAFTLGRWAVDQLFTLIDDRDGGVSMQVSASIFLAMLGGAATHALALEPMLGAFVAGILCGQARRFHLETEHSLKLTVNSFLSPIFFATAGLKVDLLKVINPTVVGWGLCIFLVACGSKLMGAAFGAWRAGFAPWERAAFGIALSARGSMAIVVATIGLSLGILAVETYSIIVLVAMATCLLIPTLLRWAFSHIRLAPEEQARLDMAGNPSFLRRLRRVLVPLRGGANADAVTQLVSRLAQTIPFDTTLMHVDNPENHSNSPDFEVLSSRLQAQMSRSPTIKKVRSGNAVALIEQESRRGYQLMLLGASQATMVHGSLFNHSVDRLLRNSGCAVAVVHVPPGWPDMSNVCKIMVPTTGTSGSYAAIEIGAALAQAYGAQLSVVYVLELPETVGDPRAVQKLVRVANSLLAQQTEIAVRLLAGATGRLLLGSCSEAEIVSLAEKEEFDLIVLRGSPRHNTGRVFLGQRAERLLKQSPCPVMVLCDTAGIQSS